MREILYPKVNDVEKAITIEADERDESGASHQYSIQQTHDGVVYQSTGIKFQQGPIQVAGVNGITNESLLAVVIDRLDGFMGGPYPSDETRDALESCRHALERLNDRTRERQARNVEGKSEQ